MKIEWQLAGGRSEYYYGTVEGSRVTSQLGNSTNAGRYVWAIFHADIGCAIAGDEAESLDEAKRQAEVWVNQWVKDRRP